jgi:PIN domain nuclease of toxin-antitoxin system
MNCLLDTHILVWAAAIPEKLGDRTTAILQAAETVVFVSPLNYLEISLKHAMGKLDLNRLTPDDFVRACIDMGFRTLPFSVEDAAGFYRLKSTIHKDPFDHLLAWLAIRHDLTLVTVDPAFREFEAQGLKLF